LEKNFCNFIACQSGATAIEYALIAGGIALVVLAAITNTGGNVGGKYNAMANTIDNALN
jgi:pilus assembly protein Flp/PilA